MRLRERDLTTVYLKTHSVVRDDEGDKKTVYDGKPIALRMNVQSAGGMVNAQIYGERLSYMKACKYQGDQLIAGANENDGICLYVDKEDDPDYVIKSIHPFSTHLNIMLEKR